MVGACIVPGSDLVLEGVGMNPTRSGIVEALLSMGANLEGSCSTYDSGEDVGYSWTAPYAGTFIFSTDESEIDTVLYIRDGDCDGTELACAHLAALAPLDGVRRESRRSFDARAKPGHVVPPLRRATLPPAADTEGCEFGL